MQHQGCGKQQKDKRNKMPRPIKATTITHGCCTRLQTHHETRRQLKLTLGAAWLPASALKLCMGCASRYQIHVQIIVGMVRSDVL